jgi:hypothetical protein
MLNARNLVLDTLSEVYQPLLPYRTHEFWDFATHDIVPNSVYVVGRNQIINNTDKVRELAQRDDVTVVFDNAAEGSWTLTSQLQSSGLHDLALNHQLLLIGGGEMSSEYAYMLYDHFIACIVDYEENLQAMSHSDEIFSNNRKPYSFLFLNGRSRPHRKYLWHRFQQTGLLNQALWTMLDSRPSGYRQFNLIDNGVNLMATTTELRWLPREYEFDFFKDSTVVPGSAERTFVKPELFKNLWGDIYLDIAPYRDTYFSLVTETVFEYPHSFRTEKIAKPLAIAHPWIAVANAGFYRDMRNLGFRTFDGIIDESFDTIDNPQDRLERIITVVQDLVSSDLPSFLTACKPVCKYNQQHLIELAPRIRAEFPDKFFNFIKTHNE